MMSEEAGQKGMSGWEPAEGSHRVLASCSLSKVFCLFSSSIRVTVTSFSLGFDSAVVMGRVTPRYLERADRNSAPDGSDGQFVTPSRFVVLQSHDFRVCRRMSGLKLQVFVEVQTQPTRGVCRQLRTPSSPTHPSRERVSYNRLIIRFLSLSDAGATARMNQLRAHACLQVYLDSTPNNPVTDIPGGCQLLTAPTAPFAPPAMPSQY